MNFVLDAFALGGATSIQKPELRTRFMVHKNIPSDLMSLNIIILIYKSYTHA